MNRFLFIVSRPAISLRAMLAVALLASATGSAAAVAAGPVPPVNGMRQADLRTHAIVGATVIPSPGERLEEATIIIRRGVIEHLGQGIDVPPDARVWSGEGLTVYPGLIEPALLISPGERVDSAGRHWNNRIHPEVAMAEHPAPGSNLREQMRGLGFTTAAVYPSSGILRGTGTVVALAEDDEHVLTYRERAAMMAGFEHGGQYPASLMGAIALMRQTFYDAQWYHEARRVYEQYPQGNEPPRPADALRALGDVIDREQVIFFDASNELNALRAGAIAREFDLDMWLLGSGTEFRRLDEVVALEMPIVLPLDFPERPDLSTLALAESTTLREMMTWEQAPTNARRLIDAGATVALTTHRLDRRPQLPARIRRAIEHGLCEDEALAALTSVPARMLGIDHITGTIEPGKVANLVVVKGSLFEEDREVRDTWINGRRHEITREPDIELVTTGVLETDLGHEVNVNIDTKRSRITVQLDDDQRARAQDVTVQRDQLSFITDGRAFDVSGFVRFSGVIGPDESVIGSGVMPDGAVFGFTITPIEADADDPEQAPDEAEQPDEDEKADEAKEAERDDPVVGVWSLAAQVEGMPESIPVRLTLSRDADGAITGESSVADFAASIENARFDSSTGVLRYDLDTPAGRAQVTARIEGDRFIGEFAGEDFAGSFTGTREARAARDADDEAPAKPVDLPPATYPVPLGAYGLDAAPQREDVIVHGATIWTAGPQGIIEDGWMHVRDGKIAAIGEGRPPVERRSGSSSLRASDPASDGEVRVIDASGKHITPGLIDCHSHTGINGGVNEWTHANTAEVRIGDVVDPDTVHWYRQLAGGLTAASLLHGSANPIGGQNAVVKLKWGASADEMLMDGAKPGIKFALGENVVRRTTRYPNTRMGVETMICDAFTAAREYEAERERYRSLPDRERRRTIPPRRDLTKDALVDILNEDMLVHCHSYRQDEILMLIRVAEDFGFTIGTFQHVLEGYKVAEAIAEHGAGASAFSDWWGFKVEVMDATPYAGALMHEMGVNVSYNSDSSELARRMNGEAAKAVRYGGVDPHEALKFVTLNPAIQLAIDDRTGSLEIGKDADFVIWSGDPLSTFSRVEQTWIEGAKYYDIQMHETLREQTERERQRLIQKILTDAHGKPDDPDEDEKEEADEAAEPPDADVPDGARSRLMAKLFERRVQWMEHEYRLGRDPTELRPGDCGCNDFWMDYFRFGP